MKLPLVLIIGRANVGKSALFNAIVGRRQALISKIPGTTRDVNFADITWKKTQFTLGDSAGLENLKEVTRYALRVTRYAEAPLDHLIELKTLELLKESSALILVVDADSGLMPQDREIMNFLRKQHLSFILAVNKVDGKNDEPKADEFLKLHIDPTFLISSITRRGIGDLLDTITHQLSKFVGAQNLVPLQSRETIRVALIGRTNVGKSTLTNTLIGREEMIVSATPHTTREPHALQIPLNEQYDIELVDTAGVRKKAKIEHFLEIAGVRMSLEKLKRTDVVLFVIDVSENLSSQDLALARLIAEHRRSCIVVGNKWDLTREKRNIEISKYRNKKEMSLRGFAKPASTYPSRQRQAEADASQGWQSSDVIPDLDLGSKKQKTKNKKIQTSNEFELYIRRCLPKLNYAPIVLVSATKGQNVSTIKPLIKQIYENTFKIFPEHDVNVILQKSLKLQPPPIVGEKKRKVQVTGLFQNSKNPKEYILKVYTRDYTPPNFVKFIEKQIRASLPLQGVPVYITVENTRLSS